MAAGLQTQIWNNNLVSGLVFFLVPPIYAMIVCAGMYLHDAIFSLNIGDKNIYPAFFAVLFFYTAFFFIFTGTLQQTFRLVAHAKPLSRSTHREFFAILETLCIQRGMRMPEVFLIDSELPNILSFGLRKRNMILGVTRGLLATMTPAEQQAVIAQELYQIRSRDTRLLTLIYFFGLPVRIITSILFYAGFYLSLAIGGGRPIHRALPRLTAILIVITLVVLSLDYIVSELFLRVDVPASQLTTVIFQIFYWIGFLWFLRLIDYFFLSLIGTHKRELIADAESLKETKNPQALVDALRKLELHNAHDTTETDLGHLFVVNPRGQTHPSLKRRIASIHEGMKGYT